MLAALISAGTALIGGAMQSSAANKATKAQVQAAREAQAARERAAREVQFLQAPGVQAYNTGLNALTGRLGLAGGVGGGGSGGSGGDVDWNEYLSRYTDVQAEFDKLSATPEGREALVARGTPTAQAFAARHYADHGRRPDENRTVKTLAETQTGGGTENALAPRGSFGNTADPEAYEAPTYTQPAEFSFSIDSFKDNPAYKFALEQGSGQVMANAAATGALQSGAALKRLQDRGQQTAYQFYDDERDFAWGKYTNERDFGRRNFETDRSFGRGVFESDRNYLTGRYDRETDDMFRYLGVGQNALNATTNALVGQGNATATGLENIGQAQAANALTQGNIWSGVVGQLGGTAAGVIPGIVQSAGLNNTLRRAAAANPHLF